MEQYLDARFDFSSRESSRFPREQQSPQAACIPTEVIKSKELAQVVLNNECGSKAEDSEKNDNEVRENKDEKFATSDEKKETSEETEF